MRDHHTDTDRDRDTHLKQTTKYICILWITTRKKESCVLTFDLLEQTATPTSGIQTIFWIAPEPATTVWSTDPSFWIHKYNDFNGKVFSVTINSSVIYSLDCSFVLLIYIYIYHTDVRVSAWRVASVFTEDLGVFWCICVRNVLPARTRYSWGLQLLQMPRPDHQGWRPESLQEWCGP